MKQNTANPIRFGYDLKLLFPVLLLTGIGIAMVYSASSAVARQTYGTDYYFLKRQAMFALLGIAALVFARHFPYRYSRWLSYPIIAAAAALLVLVLIEGIGVTAGGATRWLRVAGLSFQPSEFARMAMVIYMAYSLSKKQDQLKQFQIGMLPHVAVLGGFSALIIMEPDFGTVVILIAIAWVMMFVGGVRLMHLAFPLPLLVAAGVYLVIKAPYRIGRIFAVWDPWRYAADQAYQVVHSQMGFGTGGLLGIGVGNGYQKLFYLPEPHTDFIFSVIGEELGLVGVCFILGLYFLVVFRGFTIGRQAKDTFGSLLAVGLTTAIALQACINIGVTMGLLPPKGLPLPFLSYGGTSLLVSMTAVGILMNIAAARGKQAH